jgi:curved DNA-binding protein CbpA
MGEHKRKSSHKSKSSHRRSKNGEGKRRSEKKRRRRSASPSSGTSGGSGASGGGGAAAAAAAALARERAAARAAREILALGPALGADLAEIARQLDAGGALDASGVADAFLRGRLSALLGALPQLRRTRARLFRRREGASAVLEFLAPILAEGPEARAAAAAADAAEPGAPAGEEPSHAEAADAVADARIGPQGPPAAPIGPQGPPAAAEPAPAPAHRVLGPAAPPPELLAAAAAMPAAASESDGAAADDDDGGELVGPPPPELEEEAAAASADDRSAEVARVLKALRAHAEAAAAGRLGPPGAPPPPADPAAVLGVPLEAPAREVKKRYWRLSLLIHPDKCDHPRAGEAFQAVAAAAAELQDGAGRAAAAERRAAAALRAEFAAHAAAAERERQWRVARGEATAEDLAGPAGPPAREEWMTVAPAAGRASAAAPGQSKTAFTTRASRPVDAAGWTATPNQPGGTAARAIAGPAGPPQLAPSAAGGRTAGIVDAYNAAARPKSLLERHREQQEAAAKADKAARRAEKKRRREGGAPPAAAAPAPEPRRPFDRERDLAAGHGGGADPTELMKKLPALGSRFGGGPAGGRSFL